MGSRAAGFPVMEIGGVEAELAEVRQAFNTALNRDQNTVKRSMLIAALRAKGEWPALARLDLYLAALVESGEIRRVAEGRFAPGTYKP